MTKKAIFFCIPIGVLLFVFRDFLFFGQFFFNGDVLLANLPFLFYRGQDGAVITQNILSGFPLFVTVNASWFYPITTFFFSRFAATTAYTALTLGNIFLAYVFSYLYARKIGLGAAAAAFAGMTFVFSGQLMLWAASIIMTAYYFILPASLYLFEVAREKRGWTRACALGASGIVLGSGWLSSQVQFVVYIHAFYALYAAYRLSAAGALRPLRAAVRNLGAYLAFPYALSGLVGLPMILAVLSFQSETLRASGVSLSQAAGSGYMPWDFLHYLLPFWGVSFLTGALPNLYLGIAPLFLLFFAWVYRTELTNTFTRFYFWVFVGSLIASVRYSPIAIVLHYLPLWNAFRDSSRIMFIGGFAAALLVGAMADLLVRQGASIDLRQTRVYHVARMLFVYVGLPAAALVTLVRIFFWNAIERRLDAYFIERVYAHTTGLPKEHYFAVVRQYMHQALDQFSLFDPQLAYLLLFAAITLVLIQYQRRFSPTQFLTMLLVTGAANLALVYMSYYPALPASAVMHEPNTVTAIKSREGERASPFRAFSVFPAMTVYNDLVACPLSPPETFELQQELLQVNGTMLSGVDSVDGYENYMPALASGALDYIGSESSGAADPFFLEKVPLQKKIDTILSRKNVLRAMNVKYFASGVPLADPALTLAGSWRLGRCGNPVYLYELSRPWPRYFVTGSVEAATTSPGVAAALNELNAHSAPAILITNAPGGLIRSGEPTAEVFPAFGNRDITFASTTCKRACALLIGNTYLRGWRATVDDTPAPLLRANYLYMTLLLSPGVHRVVLTYQ